MTVSMKNGLFMGYASIHIEFKEESFKMSVQVEKLEKNMAKLTVEVSAEDFEKAVNTVYNRN